MTSEEKTELATEIATLLRECAGIATEADRDATAQHIAGNIEHALYQLGWMPPATDGAVREWATRTGSIPDHHVNRSVLTSHLSELAAILSVH